MRAGLLSRSRVKFILNDPVAQNTFGEDVPAQDVIGTFSAQVEAMMGRELELVQQRWREAKYKITMRPQPGISFSGKMRAIWNGKRTLDILDVQDTGGSLRPEVIMYARDFQD